MEQRVQRLVQFEQRNFLQPKNLVAAAEYIEGLFRDIAVGHPFVRTQSFSITPTGNTYRNIELVVVGTDPDADEVVVGAHYDSDGLESGGMNPGADDNATGVAALIEVATVLAQRQHPRTIRFVAFTNEEEPFFKTHEMGSRVYARELRHSQEPGNIKIHAMISLEMLGYFSDATGSQWGWPLLPSQGNFIAVVGNWQSRALAFRTADMFCESETIPASVMVSFGWLYGIGWSDHWSFWHEDYPAVMLTDTATLRNVCYHRGCDVPERLDFDRMAQVVGVVTEMVGSLADEYPKALPRRSSRRSVFPCVTPIRD